MNQGKIIFLSGKMGAGKSTYARKISQAPNKFLLSEDEILQSFYPDEINNIEDYVLYSNRIKPFVMKIVKYLTDGLLTVVMDFPGNTLKQREWFKKLIDHCQADHQLIYIKASDQVCLNHIMKRRKEQPDRHKFDQKDLFDKMTKFFQEPKAEEGFNLEIIEIDRVKNV